nr:MAG TPA: hypothetical protein [Bacteriophage sp.]
MFRHTTIFARPIFTDRTGRLTNSSRIGGQATPG